MDDQGLEYQKLVRDVTAQRTLLHAIKGDVWVFAYGSLMWNPGFDYLERRPALLHGYHRAFCIYSNYYRGTDEQLGVVLGLDRGGACRGLAFQLHKEAVLEVLGRFSEDLTALQRAIRWGEGEKLEAWFERTRAIRRGIIEMKQAGSFSAAEPMGHDAIDLSEDGSDPGPES